MKMSWGNERAESRLDTSDEQSRIVMSNPDHVILAPRGRPVISP